MAPAPPYMYSNHSRGGSHLSDASSFDPKAITRASWEPKPAKAKRDGPLLSVNQHPDTHMVLSYRSNNYPSMRPSTKGWIKGMRYFQLVLRLLQLNAAIGLLVLAILIKNIDEVTHWVLRISPGVVIGHCLYAIYHLSRDASRRAPGSSAAYQVFSALADLCTLCIYAFGSFMTHKDHEAWSTLLNDQDLIEYFVPAFYWTFVGAGISHLLSLAVSSWLGYMFRKISLMPPDMNPLEDNLTARPRHKKSKSSMTSLSTTESEKRVSAPLESHRRSGMPYEDVSRPPNVPFMHTRTQSRDSMASRNSRIELPSRQYQVMPTNSPRHSVVTVESKQVASPRSALRGSYEELPMGEPAAQDEGPPTPASQRAAKFTETWIPTNSLLSRTRQRNSELYSAQGGRGNKPYSALSQNYDVEEESASDSEGEHNSSGLPPHPLRAHPPTPSRLAGPRGKTPFRPTSAKSLSEISANARKTSHSRDIADEDLENKADLYSFMSDADRAFYSRPYEELKSATPPIMIGGGRKVSSGNDYSPANPSSAYGRRNVSGKIAEEGRAGERNTMRF